MSYLLTKAKKIFPRTFVIIRDFCSLTGITCMGCYEECSLRTTGIYSRNKNKLIGYFGERGDIIKTNPKPSKRYAKRYLGGVREKKPGRSKSFMRNK